MFDTNCLAMTHLCLQKLQIAIAKLVSEKIEVKIFYLYFYQMKTPANREITEFSLYCILKTEMGFDLERYCIWFSFSALFSLHIMQCGIKIS